MFALTGRAIARRVSLAATQSFAQPLVLRPAVAVRTFATSPRVLLPAAGAAKPKKATKKKAKASSDEDGDKPKSKSKSKSKAKAKAKSLKTLKAIKPPLSAREKEDIKFKKQVAREKEKKREDRALSLLKEQPDALPTSPWQVFMSQVVVGGDGSDIASFTRRQSPVYRALSDAEREPLEETARANKISNEKQYQEWVETYPVEYIYVANQARRAIQHRTGRKVKPLVDARLPKAGPTSYIRFSRERMDEGRELGDSQQTLVVKIAKEWHGMGEAERKPYVDAWRADKEAHEQRLVDLKEKAKEARNLLLAEYRAKRVEQLESIKLARRAKRKEKSEQKSEEKSDEEE